MSDCKGNHFRRPPNWPDATVQIIGIIAVVIVLWLFFKFLGEI